VGGSGFGASLDHMRHWTICVIGPYGTLGEDTLESFLEAYRFVHS
jgi:hypothetical protein